MTDQVLVVSGNPGLAMLLGRRGYDVDDCRPAADWPAAASNADAIVLDLGTAAAAADAMTWLGPDPPPILLVGQADDQWTALAHKMGSPLICLPLTPDDVLSQLRNLLTAPSDAISAPSAGPPTSTSAPASGGSSRTSSAGLPASAMHLLSPPERLAAAPAPLSPAPELFPPAAERVPKPLPKPHPRKHLAAPVADPRAHRQKAAPAEPPPTPVEAKPAHVAELVLGLLGRLAEVTSLSEVASAILADAVERCDADAGALLVQDDESWTVQASHALRPLERRLHVAGDSWLIERVIVRGLGVLVQGSDIARQRLAGSPVASWQNLAAAPIGGRQALILLGARERRFTEGDLAKLVAIDAEAAQLIARAVHVRALARALSAYADDAGSPPS